MKSPGGGDRLARRPPRRLPRLSLGVFLRRRPAAVGGVRGPGAASAVAPPPARRGPLGRARLGWKEFNNYK